MKKIALATSRKYQELTREEQPLIQLFEEKRIHAIPAIWNDPSIHWQNFESIIVRSIWDYHLYPDNFMAWLDHLETIEVQVLNPVTTLRWNSHKSYLIDIADNALVVVPTQLIKEPEDLFKSWLNSFAVDSFVIKPTISASSFLTHQYALTEWDQMVEQISPHLAERAFIIQPFVRAIVETGELSLMYFNRRFSHAVLKTAKTGEFRVQSEYGGSSKRIDVSESVVQQAQRYLDLVEGPLLYARVDGCMVDDEFVLMELELVEPSLFLELAPGSQEAFVDATIKILSQE